ncbi:MAG: glutamine-hydrolyzing GMP synthase [Thaumarchaeota archaeon]|nr:glutamine-hydrolyzing GMP synthase [Nitrososphaerota archaeon]
MDAEEKDTVIVLDFGAQYAHLIARRVRECGVYSELAPFDVSPEALAARSAKGIILSGGPASVYEANAPVCDKGVFELGIPVLGICYGLQLMVHLFGGEVVRSPKREYGKAELKVKDPSDLFKGLGGQLTVWMSHGDAAVELPEGFEAIGVTSNSPYAAIRDMGRRLFGVQFHPEVAHTPRGMEILRNFLDVCGCASSWRMEAFVDRKVEEIRKQVGGEKVLCALSGGVDSSTAAVLVHRAVGDQLTCVFVDHGLLRKNEAQEVLKAFRDHFKMRLLHVDKAAQFLGRLKGVVDPEEKRMIIGEEFVKAFTETAGEYGPFQWLAQGTLYPDVIESAGTGSPASRIKTHHNVAGLPEWMAFKLLEPLRDLYKDEVRKVASILGIPDTIVKRHPFPGPGLAVRIVGEVTGEKISVCREASSIVEEELMKSGLHGRVWQAFAVVGDDKAVGVLGDARKVGYIVTVRVVESVDAMTADWSRIPYEVLERISNRITNEVPGATWVTYAVSSKPPATIEPQ